MKTPAMSNARSGYGLSLLLTAALCVSFAPVLFVAHVDCFGAGASHPCSLAGKANRAGIDRPRTGSAHNPDSCLTCQALIQYLSGVTPADADAATIPAGSATSVPIAAAPSPDKTRFSSFRSRAPPLPGATFRS